ncbi:MAG: prephenate dehydrogenase [Eubacterium sp.]|nr:prephenate dehydrogenase [Eubacterium sp.]
MQRLNLGFVGFGLIGGSIAKALKKRGADIRVLVYSRRKNPELDAGMNEGIIDEVVYDIDDSFSSCDFIFLCAPVQRIIDLLPQVKAVAGTDTIITDVGSVKEKICDAAVKSGLGKKFIGGHPMAGSEKTGYASSTDILLENAFYLLTPSPENNQEDVSRLRDLVSGTGATCVVLDPHEHDRITALISHIPHLVAVALVNLARVNDDGEQTLKTFAAGGFRDITRIASSSPQMWEEICMLNAETIDKYLVEYEQIIRECREAIKAGNGGKIFDDFETAGEYRDSLPTKSSPLLGKAHELFVNIDDRAGAIATIATILSVAGINLKNIGIINNREFADGVLRIELATDDDVARASELLTKNRYDIVERK